MLGTMEIIQLNARPTGVTATISYQDFEHGLEINNYYTIDEIPVNIRELQKSTRGNILVNQSVKPESSSVENKL